MNALRRLYADIRYEDGRWPLSRWDLNLRYITKSLLHLPEPRSAETGEHFARVARHLASGSWRHAGAPELRLSAVGDMMWIRSGFHRALSPGVREVMAGDAVAFANLETPVDPARPVPRLVYETLHYNAPPDYLAAWEGTARHRVFSLCNNHALDQGAEGLERTRGTVLASSQHRCVGGPRPEDAVAALEVGGVRMGIAAVTYDINHLVGAPPAGVPVTRLGSPLHAPDWERLGALIDAARAVGPDLVVLMPHWGFEYEYWPEALQREHACRLIERGADLLLGSSPHVLQPVEWVSIDGADATCPTQVRRGGPARMGLIAYSLGNFLSIMSTLACQTGAVLKLALARDARGVLQPVDLRAVPTACGRGLGGEGFLDAGVVRLDELPPQRAAPHLAHARRTLGALLSDRRD
ncbi:CapA family protein [Corallococcus exiguus]|uniref:CapA family protein n=1 Tax=Corallococcus exiguus TaxID=83462 RepID=UPI00155FCF11|nr:CapA family protein [Corallococcus exiguus]NRD58195.1 CapA family protein [Corallococcus exiguus]